MDNRNCDGCDVNEIDLVKLFPPHPATAGISYVIMKVREENLDRGCMFLKRIPKVDTEILSILSALVLFDAGVVLVICGWRLAMPNLLWAGVVLAVLVLVIASAVCAGMAGSVAVVPIIVLGLPVYGIIWPVLLPFLVLDEMKYKLRKH